MSTAVRYVVYIDGTQRAEASLRGMESTANSTEQSITSLNGALASMAGAFGVGLSLKGILNAGKEAVEGAADFETAVKRIKFASDSLAEGATNISFISSEADKFKIELQGATDSYGKFLAMLAGSGMAGNEVRKLHDELLLIGKVKGLSDGQLDAAVMNLGKMLEAGAMDARHLRPLEMQLSGIGKFIADELGVSVHQLAILRNKGKLTDMDPTVLLHAVAKQAESLKQFLPESTTTITSDINEMSNAWLRFKNELVFDNRTELNELFATLKDGIKYLHEHKEGLERTGHFIVNVGKLWIGFKVSMAAASLAMRAYTGFMVGFAAESVATVSAAEAQAIAFNALALSMERVAYATEIMAGASITGAVGLGGLGIPLASAGAGAVGTGTLGAASAGAGAGALLSAAILLIPAAVIMAAEYMREGKRSDVQGRTGSGIYDSNLPGWVSTKDSTTFTILKRDKDPNHPYGAPSYANDIVTDTLYTGATKFARDSADISTFSKLSKKMQDALLGMAPEDPRAAAAAAKAKSHAAGSGRIVPPNDRITGQRVIRYDIRIGEINGIKQNTVQDGGKLDEKRVAEILRAEIIGALNDSQLRQGN